MSDSGVTILRESPFGLLTYEPALARVSLVRTAAALVSETFESEVDGLVAAVGGIDIGACGLLFDVRLVVGRNDDAFEAASLAARRRFILRFGRTAVLVKTLVGRLQGERFAREDRASARLLVTTDPAEAAAFLAALPSDAGS